MSMINFSPEQIQSSIPIKVTDKQYCQITQTFCKAQDAMKECDKQKKVCRLAPGVLETDLITKKNNKEYCESLSQKPRDCQEAMSGPVKLCEYVPDEKHVQECMGLRMACGYLLGPKVCNFKQ